ncbi:MAG: ATP-binding protein [Polyangiaceae bacterium]|jgi:predicted ATPase|nr:ATP-binding protein [Polyangiaceae bacterium]MBK8943043.1 ATP-binding protein [Polyangiaceae bacterium]
MIERLWVKNFRMLKSNAVDLRRFAVLVGRNASGKTTLMSALRFVSHVLSDGVDRAIEAALDSGGGGFGDLCFHPDLPIELALELRVDGSLYRYELGIGTQRSAPQIQHERLLRCETEETRQEQRSLFGDADLPAIIGASMKGWRKIVSKTSEAKDYFQDEKTSWNTTFRFGPTRSALGNIPEDPDRFRGAIAVRDSLRDGVMMVELDSHMLRLPSRPRSSPLLLRDGSNLAAAARTLEARDPVAYEQWVGHVGEAVEGLEAVETWERPEDRHIVLRGRFRGQHSDPVPSWLLSDGTLRLMALSLLAYAEPEGARGIVLVEEPENGLHPLAIQSVHQALTAMQTTQVLVATHSPVFLASTDMKQALVFRRQPDGTARVERGDEVAALKQWHANVRLTDVFATGILS